MPKAGLLDLWRGLAAVLLVLVAAPAAHAKAPVWCHLVKRGDTLSDIAARHGVALGRLRTLNDNLGDLPHTGTVLALPSLSRLLGGRLPLAARPLVASRGSLRRENAAAAGDDLSRMVNHRMVRRFVGLGLLVPVPGSAPTYYVAGVSRDLRVTRPWTLRFIEQLGAAFHELFGRRLRITSLIRTVETQRRLRRVNANAAPVYGPLRSTHLTGAAVDVSKRSLSRRQVHWLRIVLERLAARNLVHAVEEFRHPHFHVFVRTRYLDYAEALPDPVLIGGC